MNRSTTPAPPIAVDVAVVLTAMVRAEPDAGGYSASIPALPGCHTQGETLDQVRANLREAAEGWLAVAHDEALARAAAGAPCRASPASRCAACWPSVRGPGPVSTAVTASSAALP